MNVFKVLSFFVILLSFSFSSLAQSKQIYWTDGGLPGILSADILGGDIDTIIVEDLINPYEVIVDDRNKKIYWSDRGTKRIEQSNLDGTQRVQLDVGELEEPRGLAIDYANQKLYWVDFGTQKIQRSNLDGTDVEVVIEDQINEPHGIFIDSVYQHIYFTDRAAETLERADLDGTNRIVLVDSGLENPSGVEVDIENNKIYFSDSVLDQILSCDLLGNDVTTLVSNLGTPFRVRLDQDANKLYWTDVNRHVIERSNIDGTDVETIYNFASTDRPTGLYFYQPEPVEVESQLAKVQIIHNANHETVGIYANGKEIVSALAYLTATPYIDIPAGIEVELELRSRRAYQPAESVFKTINLDPNKSYIISVFGAYDKDAEFPIQLSLFDQALPEVASNEVAIQFFNGGYALEEVDLKMDEQEMFTSRLYGTFEDDYLAIPATRGRRIDIVNVDNNSIVGSYKLDIDWWKGNSLTIFTTGFIELGNFYPHVALSNGGTYALPLWDGLRPLNESDTEVYIEATSTEDMFDLPVINSLNNNSFSDIEIYPNPANTYINATSTILDMEDINFVIVNTLGRTVLSGDIDSFSKDSFRIRLPHLPNGTYFLYTIKDKMQCSRGRFVVAN